MEFGDGKRKRVRVKVECCECGAKFDDDYKKTHDEKQHKALLQQGKVIKTKTVGAPSDPFAAAKEAAEKR